MKALALLLVVGGLVAGTLAGATAYLVPLVLSAERLEGLTLNAPAGGRHTPDEVPPVAAAGKTLTPELLADLRSEGVKSVRVREFAWNRWPLRWLFVGSLLLLGGGAAVSRHGQRRELAAAAGGADLPPQLLQDLQDQVASLADLARRRGPDCLADVTEALEAASRQVNAFAEQRGALVSRLGMGRYAELMDRFASAERQINRAWSAAVDREFEEVLDCLASAHSRLGAARELLT